MWAVITYSAVLPANEPTPHPPGALRPPYSAQHESAALASSCNTGAHPRWHCNLPGTEPAECLAQDRQFVAERPPSAWPSCSAPQQISWPQSEKGCPISPLPPPQYSSFSGPAIQMLASTASHSATTVLVPGLGRHGSSSVPSPTDVPSTSIQAVVMVVAESEDVFECLA